MPTGSAVSRHCRRQIYVCFHVSRRVIGAALHCALLRGLRKEQDTVEGRLP
jgi:hypothetical protein